MDQISHQFHPSILREYDIRGIVGETLTEADAFALGRAYASRLLKGRAKGAPRPKIIVARDGRLSGPQLEKALMEGLMASGVFVQSIGLGPTPMLYYSVFELDADGGIMVTGSHNPPHYNGFKIMMGKKPCFGAAIQDLGLCAKEGDFIPARGDYKGNDQSYSADFYEEIAIFDRYIARLLKDFTGQAYKIAWDPANGAAGLAVEALVRALPGEHFVINSTIDGNFPAHPADPTVEENLAQLKDLVREKGCDMGFSFDGDGDRIGAVDRQGRVIWGDQILAILAGDLLKELPGAPIIADVKASQSLFDRIEALGGQAVMWKTGHSLIKAKMVELDAPLAGEMSGHIFFKHKFYGHDDALYAALRFLNAITNQGGDLAALRDALPQAVNTPELRFECAEEEKFAIVEKVRQNLEIAGADMSTNDGVRVKTEEGWWLLRASNTQAVLVARCEAKDEAGLARLKAVLARALQAAGVTPPINF